MTSTGDIMLEELSMANDVMFGRMDGKYAIGLRCEIKTTFFYHRETVHQRRAKWSMSPEDATFTPKVMTSLATSSDFAHTYRRSMRKLYNGMKTCFQGATYVSSMAILFAFSSIRSGPSCCAIIL